MNRQPRSSWLVGIALGVAGLADVVDPPRQPPRDAVARRWCSRSRSASCSWPRSSAGSSGPAACCATTSRRSRRHRPRPPRTGPVPRPRRTRARPRRRRRCDSHHRPADDHHASSTATTARARPPTTARPGVTSDDREPVTGNERLRARFEAERPFPLDEFQRRALDALDAGRSVLVAAPTGAGKTLVAEYAIAAALESGGKTFYTTPLKALSNQKYGDFVRLYGADQVGLLTGDNVDQRRRADRGDDHRSAAQHDLRAVHPRSTACASPCSTRCTTSRTAPGARCGRR